jgi:hypothetical protein
VLAEEMALPSKDQTDTAAQFVLSMCLSSTSREACAFAALLFLAQLPDATVIDLAMTKASSAWFVWTACGVFGSCGNVRLAREVAARQVGAGGDWPTDARLQRLLGMAPTPPVLDLEV